MGKSGIGIREAQETSSHPSLLTPHAPGSSSNILDAVDKTATTRGGPHAHSRRWPWAAVPLLALAAWAVSLQWQPSPPVAPAAPLQAKAPAVDAASAPVAVAAAAPEAASPQAAETPATIRELSPFNRLNHEAAATAGPEVAAAQVLPASPASAGPTSGVAATPPAAKAKARPAAPVKAASTKAASTKTAAGKPPARTSSAKTAVAKNTSPAAASDPDVDLLSALMGHLGGEHPAGATAKPLPRSPQTIAELVKSCQKKDSLEALVCQRRICAGSWGEAQACPARLAPKAADKTSTS